ncbi:MAG: UDP-glucose 4-epimerase GalE [Acidimicrobiia bacterium]|nr:UDP-glucose 4-epimerase GalE [Acidimicrobiia bacterium]
MAILLTGGCGFIGSHQAVVLLDAGHEVVLVDDLSNSRASVVARISAITGSEPALHVHDVRDVDRLSNLMASIDCEAIIHFAGMKHVAESVERPIDYLDANIGGLTSVLQAADQVGVRRLIFSSSGSVYGPSIRFPIPEHAPKAPTNPYSLSKSLCEDLLESVCACDTSWSVVALRYFNPAGAHPSGLIGEDPTQLASNVLPVIMEAAARRRASVPIFGTDLATPDGTAVRDFVHVMDVAEAHRRALDLLESPGFEVLNIGRGVGVSVRELIAATARVIGQPLPTIDCEPRPGDVPALYAATDRAERRLGRWDYRGLDDICRDAWRFRTNARPGAVIPSPVVAPDEAGS